MARPIGLGIRKETPRPKAFSVNFTPIDPAEREALLAGSSYNYAGAVRQGFDSNVLMSPIQWIMRTFPEAEPVIERRRGKASPWKREPEHKLELLLQQPNPFYDGVNLSMAIALSYFMDGNAYLLVVRNRFGEPIELWYAPHWLITPKWPTDGSAFLSHYDYQVNGRTVPLPVRDVVHLRFGLDPKNTRKGLSQLRAVLREVFTDDQAAAFSAAILRNMGVPGMVISPKDGNTVDAEALKEMRAYVMQKWRGENRGEPFVAGAPTEVSMFGFDPSKLLLANIRDISEERVCAAIGIPAAVVGFGSGLQSTKVGATMRELRKLAWVQCITPSQRSIARQIGRQLLPEFEEIPTRYRVRYDTAEVSAFQEELTELARRVTILCTGGIIKVNTAQEMLGLEVDETQDLYLRPVNLQPLKPGDDPLAPAPAPPADEPEEDDIPKNRVTHLLEPGANGRGD